MISSKFKRFFQYNDFFSALSKSFLICLPLFVIGSFSLLITNFPVTGYTNFLNSLLDGDVKLFFEYVSRGTFDIISIALVISICFNYASIKKLNHITIFAMMICGTASYLALVYEPNNENAFGIKNLFTSIVVCAIACNMYLLINRYTNDKRTKFLGNSNYTFQLVIQSIFPTAIIILLFAFLKVVLIFIFKTSDINSIIALPLNLFFKLLQSDFLKGFLYVLLVHFFWCAGIHGSNILEGVVKDNFMITANTNQIFTKTFNDTFILMGGSGVLLALVIAVLLFSKQKSTKKLGCVSLITVPFNINELMIFGLPIVFNPTFIIPFVCVPLICFFNSFIAVKLGFIPLAITEVNWTTPIFFSGYLATGSINGSILQFFNLIVSVLIYMPFVKKYDKVLDDRLENNIKELHTNLFAAIDKGIEPKLIKETGNLGGVARLLIMSIDEAIKNDSFEMYYQGQFNKDEKCYGAESLLRFKYKNKITIAPPLIIQLAKEGELLYKLEMYLLSKIVRDIKKHQFDDLIISFNITIPTLMNDRFEKDILQAIDNDSKIAKHINIELTEESSFTNDDSIIKKIYHLTEKGFVFSIDDFGMGKTSLLYLQTNCFKELKLDGSLVKQLLSVNTNEKIISSIVYLSKTIKFEVVAEYVETFEEYSKLKQLGVYNYQGYYFAKPMPYKEFVESLKTNDFWKN